MGLAVPFVYDSISSALGVGKDGLSDFATDHA